MRSLPYGERGLKLKVLVVAVVVVIVAPLRGAWIETNVAADYNHGAHVAPLRGAWIETTCR